MYPRPITIHDKKHSTIPTSIALYLPIHTSAKSPYNGKEINPMHIIAAIP